MPYEKIGKNEPVCIADEIPFEIPDSWEICHLKDICMLTDGIKMQDKILPILDAKFLRGRSEGNFIKNGKFVQKNTTIILVDGENSGEIFIAPTDGYLGSTFKILQISLEVNIEYVLNFIESNKILLRNSKKGAAIPHLNKDIFFNLLLGIPPLNEQKRIVEKLEEILPHIAEYGKKETELSKLNKTFPDLLKKSILQEAVQGRLVPQNPDDEPASELLKQIRKEKEKLIKDKKIKKDKNESYIFKRDNSHYEKIGNEERCIDDEIPFDIPDNWEWARLGSVVYNNGQTTPKEEFSYIDIGSIDNVRQKLNQKESIVKPGEAPSRARKIVKYGDILYSTVRPYLHNMCIIDKQFSKTPIASTGFAVMTTCYGIYNKFLFYYLLAPCFDNYANNRENSKGVAYPAINDEKLYKALIPLPPLAEQQRIVTKLDELLPDIERLT